MDSKLLYFNEGFHVDHWGNLVCAIYIDLHHPSPRPPIPLLVKGCRLEHAIEHGNDVKITTPKTFRCQGENLIRDPGEGYFSETRVLHDAIDDPRDMERARQRNQDLNRAAELTGFGWCSSTTGTQRTVSETNTLRYTPRGWLFCASIAPTTPEEWSDWQATLDDGYDHVSYIYRPREFARALGSMVAEQIGAQAGMGPMTSSLPGKASHRTQHPLQIVFHGPVVYVDDVESWLLGAKSEDELFRRSVFTKGMSHQAQRKYRFMVCADVEPEHDCHLLRATPALVDTMTGDGNSIGPPGFPTMESVEDDSARHDDVKPNPLVGHRMWFNLVGAIREQAEQPGAIVRPHRLDSETLPSDFRIQTAAYAGVTALRNKVRDFHELIDETEERRNAVTAAAWFAEQDIRILCETLEDPIAGISISEDGFMLVHISLHEHPEMECRLAVAPSGHSTIKMEKGSRHSFNLTLEPFCRNNVGEKVKEFVECI